MPPPFAPSAPPCLCPQVPLLTPPHAPLRAPSHAPPLPPHRAPDAPPWVPPCPPRLPPGAPRPPSLLHPRTPRPPPKAPPPEGTDGGPGRERGGAPRGGAVFTAQAKFRLLSILGCPGLRPSANLRKNRAGARGREGARSELLKQ